jgi:hypothetical protein
LRNLISEAATIASTADLPQRRGQRITELLTAAMALADHLIETPPAAALGKRGGERTKERHADDPDYYRRIAAQRKTRKGGRPKKA